MIALALVPTAAVAYVNRDAVRHALLTIIPSINGPITVRNPEGKPAVLSMRSISFTMGNARHLSDYEATMGIAPVKLLGLPQQARIHKILFVRKPGYALVLQYDLGKKYFLAIAFGPEKSTMVRAMNAAALNGPTLYRTWLFKGARFIATSNALSAAQLARIEDATRASRGRYQ